MDNKEKVISKLKGLQEFVVLQRWFDSCDIKQKYDMYDIEAKDEQDAWEQVNEEIAGNNSQEWLMTKEEVEYLIKFLQEKIK